MPHVLISETTDRRLKAGAGGLFRDRSDPVGNGMRRIWLCDKVKKALDDICREQGCSHDRAINMLITSKLRGKS